MRYPGKVWRWLAGVLLLVVVASAALPYLFRGPIEARVKSAVAAKVAARVNWRRVHVGLLRSFPNLTLGLQDLTVAGVDGFAGDTLLSVPSFRLVLDAGSVLRNLLGSSPVVIRSVALERPRVRLLVLEDGSANWNIMRPREGPQPEGERALELSLRRLAITGADVAFDNRQAGLRAELAGLTQTLRGDFSKQQFTLQARAVADTASLEYAGVPYLHEVRLELTADVAADLAKKLFTIRQNELSLNELKLVSQGSVGLSDDTLALDVAFAAPAADFRDILSLVPAVYARDFATLETAGTVAVNGWVRGGWSRTSFPALALNARVQNGSFRYPDLPLPVRDIGFDMSITNPGGSADSTVVRVDPFHLVLGSDALDGSFGMRTPVSDPDVAFRLRGNLDLANVGRAVKLPKVAELRGRLAADASMRARLSAVDARQYDRVNAAGTMELTGFVLRSEALRQPLEIERARLRFTPRTVELPELRGRLGSSDVALAGSLDNLLGFVLREQPLRGQAELRSRHFDLNEWRSGGELSLIEVPGNLDVALDAAADTVVFGQLTLTNAQGGLRLKDQRATLQDFRLRLLGGALTATGYYDSTDPAEPSFDVNLGLADLDIPAAFNGLRTVQAFAPVARYAQGRVSAQLAFTGALGQNMLPVLELLTGRGDLSTTGLVLSDFPPLDGLSSLLKLPQLNDPGFVDLRSAIEIRGGRLYVKPFDVKVGQLTMSVAGSNGIDKSLDYTLALQLPRAALGPAANDAVARIVAQSARAGVDLQAADVVNLAVGLGGTVTAPKLDVKFRDAAAATGEVVKQAIRDEAQQRAEAVEAKLDSTATAAQERVSAEAARLLAEAEQRAAAVRTAAQQLAETTRREANVRADSLEARASNPVARLAAKAAADRVRKEADGKAAAIVKEADTRAEAIMAEARRRAGLAPEAPPDTGGGGR